MAKQSEQLQQQIENNGGTGEISYRADDDEKKNIVRQCPSEARGKKKDNRDEPHQRIREGDTLRVRLLNPSPTQYGCV